MAQTNHEWFVEVIRPVLDNEGEMQRIKAEFRYCMSAPAPSSGFTHAMHTMKRRPDDIVTVPAAGMRVC